MYYFVGGDILNSRFRLTDFRYGLTKVNRPPECWVGASGDTPAVSGELFDIWSFGILSLSMFVRKWIDTQAKVPKSWPEDVLPHLQQVLQETNFECQVKSNFPGAKAEEIRIKNVLNMLKGTLCLQPEKRPSASLLLKHKIFDIELKFGLKIPKDGLWASECKENTDENKAEIREGGKSESDSETLDEKNVKTEYGKNFKTGSKNEAGSKKIEILNENVDRAVNEKIVEMANEKVESVKEKILEREKEIITEEKNVKNALAVNRRQCGALHGSNGKEMCRKFIFEGIHISRATINEEVLNVTMATENVIAGESAAELHADPVKKERRSLFKRIRHWFRMCFSKAE